MRATNFNPRTPCGVRRLRAVPRRQVRRDFNPRTPCGVRPFARNHPSCLTNNFNPRTPCGVRRSQQPAQEAAKIFQSTHPLRGATKFRQSFCPPIDISIHAPLAGCDAPSAAACSRTRDFNPRTPCGVRPSCAVQAAHVRDFNPRTPCGVRLGSTCFHPNATHFNPRTPCGVRRSAFLS